jgi:TRAP-type C4-dicarboxylate transport system permease small subunit
LAAVILSLFFLVWGGFNWLMSEGDKQRLGNARQKVVYAILGLIVAFFSFLIVNTIYAFLLGNNSGGPFNYPK